LQKIRIELNREGVRQLLRSQAMEAHLAARARQILNRLGDGYATDTHVGRNRCNAMVWAETAAAVAETAEHNTLLKAVHG